MKLSSKGEYGLLAMIDLALHVERGPVQSFQIAQRHDIQKQYLAQLLLILKKAGLIESSRGRQGGYQLARPTPEITLLDIITALEGPIENVNFCAKSNSHRNQSHDILREIWTSLVSHTVAVLSEKTLEDF